MKSDLSEQRSENSELCSVSRAWGSRIMSSVAAARSITRERGDMFAPGQGWQSQVSAVHRAITAPEFPGRLKQLTWNRVRSWFFAEARRLDYDEMVALKELKAHEEAKREYREFITATNRMAVVLAREGASLSRRQMEVLERIARRSLDVSGDRDAGSSIPGRTVAVSGIPVGVCQ